MPTLLVHGALPRQRFTTDKPTKRMFERAVAVMKAFEQMSRYFARLKLREVIRSRNGSEVSELYKASNGSRVLFYQTEKNAWEGPFTLLNVQNETCIVQ